MASEKDSGGISWQWVAMAAIAGLGALVSIGIQNFRSTDAEIMKRLDTLETRQIDLRDRLTRLEAAHIHETLSQIGELRERYKFLEERLNKRNGN